MIDKVHKLVVYTDHRQYNLSCVYLVKVGTPFKLSDDFTRPLLCYILPFNPLTLSLKLVTFGLLVLVNTSQTFLKSPLNLGNDLIIYLINITNKKEYTFIGLRGFEFFIYVFVTYSISQNVVDTFFNIIVFNNRYYLINYYLKVTT